MAKKKPRRGRVNLKYQMKQAISEISKIGQSKRELKKTGEHGLHSYNQIQETLSVSANFVNWAREQGIKNLYQLTPGDYVNYIEWKRSQGVTNGHLMNIETSLRHLQKGMGVISTKLKKEPILWTTEKRMVTERDKPVDRSYTHDEIKGLIDKMSPEVAKAAELSYRLGFRAREIANLRVEHIQRNREGKLEICFNSVNAKGLTKGGRPRITPIPLDMQAKIEAMVKGKQPHERVLKITAESTLRSGLSRASKCSDIESTGWHGFRHTYARNRLNELLGKKGLDEKGPKMLQRIFENRDKGKKVDYGVLTQEDKQTYLGLKSCIDQVHAEIGHGKDRWDLAEIYMK